MIIIITLQIVYVMCTIYYYTLFGVLFTNKHAQKC